MLGLKFYTKTNEISAIGAFGLCLPISRIDLLITGYGMLLTIREAVVISQT